MTQPFDTQPPTDAAPGGAVAELPPPPAPRDDAPAPAPTGGPRSRAVGAKPAGRSRRAAPVVPRIRTGRARSAGDTVPPCHLDTKAVEGIVGLDHEVRVLRAAIRHLAGDENAAPHVRTLAELRHQVEALCTALKTQHALDGRGDDLSADLARALEELGDELGVAR